MKFRKKTMATLFAAVLIAMMGVMPALAVDTATVPMTVTVLQIDVVSITALPSPITFPDVVSGQIMKSDSDPLVITNTGNVDVTIDVSVEGADDIFYEAYLYTSPDDSAWTIVTGWVEASHVILESASEDIYLQIDMTLATPSPGLKSANLVVFASKTP